MKLRNKNGVETCRIQISVTGKDQIANDPHQFQIFTQISESSIFTIIKKYSNNHIFNMLSRRTTSTRPLFLN